MSNYDNQTERAPQDRPFILVRKDRDLSLSYFFSSYLETATSETLIFKGIHLCSLRLYEPTARKNAMWQGWSCITEEYYNEIGELSSEEVSEEEKEAVEPEITIDATPRKKATKRTARRKK